jgi:heme exporter protein A
VIEAEAALAPGPAPAAPAGEDSPAVLLEELGRSYGEREVLRGVSVRLERGRTLAVLGGNGAGKSTLLRVLATLARPHEGCVEVLGRALPREARAVRGRVGYLGHDPMLYPELDARENLRLHARLHGVALARVDELLEAVGLGRRARDPVRELSRGMVQRVAAARAVLHDPELLLLDEPRAGLDPAAAALVEPLLGPAPGRTRVLVTHDAGHALAEADLVLGLRRGRPRFLTGGRQILQSNIDDLYA